MSTPLHKLPSLELIRGFVAVGRRMSITQAAADLFVTQSAVSRQIRSLEDQLGLRLLVRGHRSIRFTSDGARLFEIADAMVRQLQDVVTSLGEQRTRRPVTITASYGFTTLWLLPRLGNLQHQHPEVDVRVAADNRVLDLEAEGIELGIRYCTARQAPPGATRLFGESLAPVAHPSLRIRRLASATVLARQVLLEFDMADRPWLHWDGWLSRHGLGQIKPRGRLRFNQYDQVIQAAVAGQGVAIGRLELLAPMLADGRLVALTAPDRRASDQAFWLIAARNATGDDTARVAGWILSEARSLTARGSTVRKRPPDSSA